MVYLIYSDAAPIADPAAVADKSDERPRLIQRLQKQLKGEPDGKEEA